MAPKMCGTFEMGKCVGMGATASVYIAYEPNMRKEVAIKVLKHSQNSVKSIRHEVIQPIHRECPSAELRPPVCAYGKDTF